MSQGLVEIGEAEAVLRNMFASARVELPAADLRPIWSVFKEFCRTVKVNTPSDIVLFEIGVFNFFGAEQFHLHFVRQFAHPEEDDEEEPIQLDCVWLYDPVDELRGLGRWNRWSVQDPSLEAFFATVEGQPYLDTANRYRPVEVKLFQEQQ
jgi:hypothetical protein